MTEVLSYVEIDLPYCSRVFGVSPCRAALGVGFPTGGIGAPIFDGANDYLRRVGGITGASDVKTFTVAGVVLKTAGDAASQVIFRGASALAGATERGVAVSIDTSNGLQIQARNAAGAVILLVNSPANLFQIADGHVSFAASFDLSDTGKRFIIINGVSVALTVTTYTDDTIDLTIADWSVGAIADGNEKFTGDMPYLWFDDSYLDLSLAANIAAFYTTNPVYLGSAGELPTGASPLVFLAGDVATWGVNNGTGGDFTVTGTLGEGLFGTGSYKCFNTLRTCQDRTNFNDVPQTYRFAVATDYLPTGIEAIPSMVSAPSITPATISLGEDLGQRATLTATFKDHKWADTGTGYDPYVSERDYAPYSQGTYFGKFRARHRYVRGRDLRLITGTVGQALAAMENRHYVIDSFDGPSPSGEYRLIAKDVLKLADDNRALAPALSEGSLNAAITDVATSLVLKPTGVGALYPASGHAALGGKEIVSYTRSSDTLTITRAQLNTVAQAHDVEDRVQDILVYSGEDPADIIYDLLVNYAGVDAAYIPLATWQTETDTYLTRVYTTYIAEPTGVNQLVSEVIAQAGLAVWWDDVTQEIKLRVLRAIPTDAAVFDEDNTLEGTLQVSEQPEKRISQTIVYYGQINPLKPVDEKENYRSALLNVDLQSSGDYGSTALRTVLARWIPAFGSSTAQRLSDILIGRFLDPPRLFNFDILRHGDETVALGGGYLIGGWSLQDDTGAQANAPVQVTRLAPKADRYSVEAEEVLFQDLDPAALVDRVVTIDGDTTDFDLRAVHDTIYQELTAADVTAGVTLRCVVNAGVVVGSTSTSTAAFDVGTFPAGLSITIEVLGRIQGKGGAGASVSEGATSGVGADGRAGGLALYTRYAVDLDGDGDLWGGGGGGGAPTNTPFLSAGGGGGGTGYQVGPGGAGKGSADDGADGTQTAGGAGGNGTTTYDGGDGGAPGTAGAAGGTASGAPAGGAGGSAGSAIDGVSYVTAVGTVDVQGPTVN